MKRWYPYIKPYLPYFILGPICMIIEVVGEIFMPSLLATVINDASAGTLTVGTSLGVMGLMIGLALVMMWGGIGGAWFGSKASVNFAADLRRDVYAKIQDYSFNNIDKFSTGSLVTRLTNDVTQLQNFVMMLLRMALRAPGMLIGGLIMAIIKKPSLSLVFAVSIPLLLICILGIISVGFPRFAKMQTRIDALNSTVRENVTNVRVVKSFVRQDLETEKFSTANGNLKEAGMSAMRVMIFIMPVMNLFMYGATIATIWFGHKLVFEGMPVGDLSAFITYVTMILSSLMMVTLLFMTSSRAMASGKRICEVLDEKIDIENSLNADPELTVQNGSVEFKNVCFRYFKNNENEVRDHIDLKIEAGQTVGIIGSTGCGKTTLVSLIPRLYDADGGEVLIDGKNVKEYTLHNLREGVGMVLQKNVLFAGTISENLRWGNENATDEEVIHASNAAAADKFITSFKDGYDTALDKGGSNVSGGQKQRLCIARALLKKPKILILDDSTSAVDTATERQIREALTNDLKDTTKLIIAQRISSVKDADMIVVMDDGKITGIGNHEQLLQSNEEYKEIYYSQMDKEEKKEEA
ncbi:MAG: ABC transporter ATP-binding protein/permease [Clostridia bacterium]|nr:ABC transporter ATP-binding protein/permease [Clostridia bacterium]